MQGCMGIALHRRLARRPRYAAAPLAGAASPARPSVIIDITITAATAATAVPVIVML